MSRWDQFTDEEMETLKGALETERIFDRRCAGVKPLLREVEEDIESRRAEDGPDILEEAKLWAFGSA